MSLPNPPIVSPSLPQRSIAVTAIGGTILVLGLVVTPVSALSLLMILARSYGTASTDVLGFLSVVVAPPAAVVAGIGLLRRRRWAWYAVLLLLGFVILCRAWELVTEHPETTTYTSASGVRTIQTDFAPASHNFNFLIIAIGTVLVATLVSRPIRREFGIALRSPDRSNHGAVGGLASRVENPESSPAVERDWRVGHQGRDRMYYEESHGGAWRRIDLDGEMLMGRAHHVIYFASSEGWQSYPEWARHRRAQIIDRIKSELRAPDYEYRGDGLEKTSAAPLAPTRIVPPRRVEAVATAKQTTALVLVIVVLLAASAGVGWFVSRGVDSGATILPTTRGWPQRAILRQDDPAMFWVAIGFYSALGLGSGGLALWFIREGMRPKRQ